MPHLQARGHLQRCYIRVEFIKAYKGLCRVNFRWDCKYSFPILDKMLNINYISCYLSFTNSQERKNMRPILTAEQFWDESLGKTASNASLDRFRQEVEHRSTHDNGEADKDYVYMFVYGSLMWSHEDYHPVEAMPANLEGYRRDVLQSTVYRGTPFEPGMVFGLNAADDAKTEGVVLKIPKSKMDEAFAAYKKQEMSAEDDVQHGEKQHGMYRMIYAPVTLENGRKVNAITVVTNPLSPKATTNEKYTALHGEDGDLSLRQKAWMIVRGRRREAGIEKQGEYSHFIDDDMRLGFSKLSANAKKAQAGGNTDSGRSVHYFRNTLKTMHEKGIEDPYLEALSKEVDTVEALYKAWAKNISKAHLSEHAPITLEEREAARKKAEDAGRKLFTDDIVLLDQTDTMRPEARNKRNNPLATVFTDRVQHFKASLER